MPWRSETTSTARASTWQVANTSSRNCCHTTTLKPLGLPHRRSLSRKNWPRGEEVPASGRSFRVRRNRAQADRCSRNQSESKLFTATSNISGVGSIPKAAWPRARSPLTADPCPYPISSTVDPGAGHAETSSSNSDQHRLPNPNFDRTDKRHRRHPRNDDCRDGWVTTGAGMAWRTHLLVGEALQDRANSLESAACFPDAKRQASALRPSREMTTAFAEMQQRVAAAFLFQTDRWSAANCWKVVAGLPVRLRICRLGKAEIFQRTMR